MTAQEAVCIPELVAESAEKRIRCFAAFFVSALCGLYCPLLMIDYLQTISMTSVRQLLLSIVTIMIGQLSLPAQQNTPQDLKAAAATIIAQRGELYGKKDAAGIAAEFTADVIYVELLPRLEVMHGKAEVQKHYQQLIDAGATNFALKITQVEPSGNDSGLMAGDYTVVANGKTITGHWFEILRQEAGTWKIAVHVFARPEPIIEWL
jgi:ketosteroid isomerase-like protein